MPVTAKLSRKFYETFGDEIANELVEWFNQVDATYRADLVQLNELNFSRFEAKLDQHMTRLDAKWTGKWQELDGKLDTRLAQLDAKLSSQRADMIKWMFVFWLGMLVPLAGLMLGLML
ncbi:MAG: hypothetical protein JSW71_13190 [Gemmatimonadota bacterium]|nr:MAG: hypothetical protein JSW71_13190 [Gemmatimonadota bacterium]